MGHEHKLLCYVGSSSRQFQSVSEGNSCLARTLTDRLKLGLDAFVAMVRDLGLRALSGFRHRRSFASGQELTLQLSANGQQELALQRNA